MSIYVNYDHLIDYLREVRKNRIVKCCIEGILNWLRQPSEE